VVHERLRAATAKQATCQSLQPSVSAALLKGHLGVWEAEPQLKGSQVQVWPFPFARPGPLDDESPSPQPLPTLLDDEHTLAATKSLQQSVSLQRSVCRLPSTLRGPICPATAYSSPNSRMRRQSVVRLIPRMREASWRRQRLAWRAPRIRAASTASASTRRVTDGRAAARGTRGAAAALGVETRSAPTSPGRSSAGSSVPCTPPPRTRGRSRARARCRATRARAAAGGHPARSAARGPAGPPPGPAGSSRGLDVLAPVAQGRDLDRHHAQAVEEVFPEAPSCTARRRSTFVAAMIRASLVRARSRPRARMSAPAGHAAASPAGAAAGRPPRRRKRVPRRPARSARAVADGAREAPRTWPKSSLSSSSPGSAPQFTATNGPPRRGSGRGSRGPRSPCRCRFSPVRRIVASLCSRFSISRKMRSIAGSGR